MTRLFAAALIPALLCLSPCQPPVKALVITGGHGFDAAPFDAMLKALPGTECTRIDVKDDGSIFEEIARGPWSDKFYIFEENKKECQENQKKNIR